MQTAEFIIKQAGLKSTASRLEVISVLVNHNDPLTHHDILKQLPDNFDRVTLYRVLDWLLQNGITHRVVGEDRVWRFQLNGRHKTVFDKAPASNQKDLGQHSHAHFQCSDCGKIFCLEHVYPKLSNTIPADFDVDSVELNIKGKCANCQK
jgi:Fur family ferric uptake transcriptional regulator